MQESPCSRNVGLLVKLGEVQDEERQTYRGVGESRGLIGLDVRSAKEACSGLINNEETDLGGRTVKDFPKSRKLIVAAIWSLLQNAELVVEAVNQDG